MATQTATIIRCDHVHKGGQQCREEVAQDKIEETQPMYELTVQLSAVDASGVHTLVSKKLDLCFWDLYSELSDVYDVAKADVEARKQAAIWHAEALENDE